MQLFLFLCPFLGFLGIALLVILSVIAYGFWNKHAQEEAWKTLASRTGLSYERGGFFARPSLTGEINKHPVMITIHSHSTGYKPGSSSYPYTQIRFTLLNRDNSILTIQEKHHLSFLIKARTPIGDPAIDDRFSINCVPPTLAGQLFSSLDLYKGILSTRWFDLEITGSELCFEARGIEKDVDYLIWLLRLLYGVVVFIEKR